MKIKSRKWSPAQRAQLVYDCFANGFLCKCSEIRLTPRHDPQHGTIYIEELFHDLNCEGQDTMKRLLEYKCGAVG